MEYVNYFFSNFYNNSQTNNFELLNYDIFHINEVSHIGRPPWISVKQRKTHIETKGETMDWDRLEADIPTTFSAQNNFQHLEFTMDDSTASVCGPVKTVLPFRRYVCTWTCPQNWHSCGGQSDE